MQNWESPPAQLSLPGDEVHVWRAWLDQPAAKIEQLAQTLAAEEQLRAERFYFERDRRHFMVGRGLLRTILGQYLKLEPGQLHFVYGARGKPALLETLNPDCISFNLAHSHGLALFAITRQRDIGVDLEQIRPMADIEQIAERFFSLQETATLRSVAPDQQQEAFFNCWTRKEAYIKATGDGLAQPLDQFDVSLAPGEPARLWRVAGQPEATLYWSLQALTPAPGYAAALIVAGHDWRLRCWQWTP